MDKNVAQSQSTTEKRASQLDGTIITTDELNERQKDEMYNLLKSNYNNLTREQFLDDLAKKDYIILLKDCNQTSQGFSTAAVQTIVVGNNSYNIYFSGDTIINPDYWGTQELVKQFSILVGRLINGDKSKKWYWFLISKGHRTYMYLPLFFKKYYPGLHDKYKEELKPILNKVASNMFGESFKPDRDLIIFPSSIGELKPELVEGSFNRTSNKHVSYFLEKNPEFHKGHELACLAPLTLENMHPRLTQHMGDNTSIS